MVVWVLASICAMKSDSGIVVTTNQSKPYSSCQGMTRTNWCSPCSWKFSFCSSLILWKLPNFCCKCLAVAWIWESELSIALSLLATPSTSVKGFSVLEEAINKPSRSIIKVLAVGLIFSCCKKSLILAKRRSTPITPTSWCFSS
jgi:hypothetical protein